ncbi:MAG: hypothetical protein O9295_21870 [Microcystis sp. LE18-22.4A]|nr:hypothetical protein [Microcystis sp. LE18-22.4A]
MPLASCLLPRLNKQFKCLTADDIYRIVEVLWAIDFDNPPVSAKADAMFDYREVLNYQGGKVMELEKLPTFRQRWDDDGGLGGFQTYIQNLLGLSSNN